MSEELSNMASKLLIPVNEAAAEAPSGQEEFEYANPVTLNNRLILYGNAVIEATDRLNRITKQIEAAKHAKRTAERVLAEYETRLLRKYPSQKNLTTLKLVQAHLDRVAFDLDDTAEQYDGLRKDVEKAEDAQEHWEAKAGEIRMWMKAIETASQNIMTHLSFVKFGGALGGR